MLGHASYPLDTRRFKANVRIKPAHNGALNDYLSLLLKQLNQLLLGANMTTNPPI